MSGQGFEFLVSGGLTDIGRNPKHGENEDAVVAMPRQGLFCVSDGMGGLHAGNVASQTAVDTVREAFDEADPAGTLEERTRAAEDALRRADERIKATGSEAGGYRMGATAVLMLFSAQQPHRGCVLHAGDSRAYRYRDGQLTPLTRDHSLAAAIDMAPDRLPPDMRNAVTNGLGCSTTLTVERTPVDVRSGDLYMLCSDGLTRMVSDARLQALLRLRSGAEPQRLCEHLVAAANRAGGKDNITVALIGVGDIGAAPAEGETGDTAAPVAPVACGPVARVQAWFAFHARAWLAVLGATLVVVAAYALLRGCASAPPPPPPATETPPVTAPPRTPKPVELTPWGEGDQGDQGERK